MKKKSPNFYVKLMTFMIVLSTLPVIVLGIFSYLKSSEVIQNNVAKEKEHSIYQIQTNIEQVLKTVDHSLTHFVSSSQLQETLNEPLAPEQFQLYNHIREELSHLQTFDTGLNDVLLVSLRENWMINNKSLRRLTSEQNKEIHDKYLTLANRSTWVLDKKEDQLFDSKSDAAGSCAFHINLVKQLPLNSVNKTGVSVASIPICKFAGILSQNSELETTVILDEKFQVIGHSDFSNIGKDFSNKDFIKSLLTLDHHSGQYNLEINENDYKVTYRKSVYNNWTYLSLIKISDLNKQSSSIGWFTIYICTFLLILSLTISLVGSNRIYRPVRQLQEVIINKIHHKPTIHPKNEFELIEKQIEHMLEQNSQLEEKVRGQVNQLKQFFMVRLFQGKVSEDELSTKLASFGFNQTYKRLCVFTLQIDTLEGTIFDKKEEDLLLFTINTMIEDLVPSQHRFIPIVMNRTQATLFLNNHESDEKYTYYINQLAQQIQAKVKEELNIPVSIGISLPFSNLVSTYHAYKEGLEALKYTLKFGTESIIFFDNLERATSFYTFFPKQIENELFDAIKVCDKEKVDQILGHFLDSILEKDLNHTQYQISIVRLLNDLIELMQTLGIDLIEMDNKKSLFDHLYELKTFDEVKHWFKSGIIHPLLSKIEERTESQYKNLSDKIIHIIQQDFDQDLTLDSIATKLHYNPNYLSSIFRKEMHISFSEYLGLYRLNMAKQWLMETDMSVKEISEKLKYNNPQNFIRSFRKNEGTTPGKYRELKKAQ
ncbi:helix-turn-helix domain-containing protein [Litchfieldia salsa]|uniref:Helix-turn-helix domain-containing protein n=1 Tax=Litchfieldia salsa TaxID=930152 RepID=A0A1H0PR14_9BACI|nr:helix-turn-helix domain-containing protein [Litchfieldia salsa]SDP07591.1 Helix-turn-helix domain-containing protein [Litchfieldia salsa]